ncbi:hypothetical protein N7G274_008471 [Stereocaulon virgatum]|uniref:NADH-ubiquinone oxidoreductase 21 kDa subunit n=1 Tax=Stereocaulon virgatum TaxID=373712 RepID=A0ABR3ZZ99_9LECA
MTDMQRRPYVPPKQLNSPYPLIDSDPHFKRVCRYARTSDYFKAGAFAAFGPGLMLLWEKISPSHVSKSSFASVMRLSYTIGAGAGFLYFYTLSIQRFYGMEENQREIEMDMREMVDKVKKGEPLYGRSSLTPYMQGVAARNSRYTGIWLHVIPWFNFVNHDQHGVDTAKYYRQAERELAAEQEARANSA